MQAHNKLAMTRLEVHGCTQVHSCAYYKLVVSS
jgi:hypothetical protein